MQLGRVNINRKQVIGAVLAWALVGSLLLMRSFSVNPEAPPGNLAGGGEADAAVQSSMLAPHQTRVVTANTASEGSVASAGNTVSIPGLSAGEENSPAGLTGANSPTIGAQGKPAQAVLGDEGGVYYFPLAGSSAQASTPTWYVKVFTPRPTSTPRATYTPSSTPTPRPSFTPRYPATASQTPSLTPTRTNTLMPTSTLTPSLTAAPTQTQTASLTPTHTLTPTNTATPTATLPAEPPVAGSFAFVSRGTDGAADSVNLLELPGEASAKIAELDRVELCGWSPDGSRLLVQLPRGDSGLTDLQVIAVDGTLIAVTTALPGSSQCGDWIGDDGVVLFPYTDDSGVTSLSELTLAAGELKQVYQDGNSISQPQISPDGRQVVFIIHDGAGSDVALLDLDTGVAVRLTDTLEAEDTPRVSPDGQTVVFARQVEEGWALFTVNITTREETRLTLTSGSEQQPDWSTDGQYLVFTSDESGARNIYTYKLGEAAPMLLLPDPANQDSPLWRP